MLKLLVIGAGIGQIPLILKAKERGIFVLVASVKGGYPGESLADEFIECDIYDREKLLKIAKEKSIDGVISDQNDLMMPTVAYIAEKLNLPGNSFAQTWSYCNKNTFRTNCDYLGIPGPKHVEICSEEFDITTISFSFPWMIKPADSQSSIGVAKVENYEQARISLRDALNKSKTHAAIIEEFFVGKEVVCEGFIYKGKYFNLAFADREYFLLSGLAIPSKTLFPSRLDNSIKEKIINYESKMAAYVNPSFGIVHSEWLYNDAGDVCVVESAIRGGGVYISSHLIPQATGIDINEVLLNLCLGQEVDISKIFSKIQNKAAGYICFYLPQGVVTSISGMDALEKQPGVFMVEIKGVKIGEITHQMTHKGQRLGPILIKGNSRDDLEQIVARIKETLHIEVLSPEGVVGDIIWN